MKRAIFCFSLLLAATSVSILAADFDVIIKNGAVYDGSGGEAQHVDLAIRGGVTTEIMGEGESMGPLNEELKKRMLREQSDIKFDIKWNTLAEYLQYLERRGISCNVASFIGAATIRENVIGFEDKVPTAEQLDQMRELVRKEMEAGALGIGTALIYPPAFYSKTDELIELCKVAAT